MLTNHIYLIYKFKLDLALNNLQWLLCHKTKLNQTKPNQTKLFIHTHTHSHTHTHTHIHICIYIYIYIYIYKCYGDISYHTPNMDSSNLNIFSELSSLGEVNFSFLTRHLTDCKPRTASTYFVWLPVSANIISLPITRCLSCSSTGLTWRPQQ